MKSKKLIQTKSGFSLLEVLIATVTLAFLMLSVTLMVGRSGDAIERITAEDKEYLSLETGLSRMQRDVAHLYSPLYYSEKYSTKYDPYNYNKKKSERINPNNAFEQNRRFAFVSTEGHPVPIYRNDDKTSFEFFTLANRRKMKNSKQSYYAWIRYYIAPMDKEAYGEDDPRKEKDLSQLVREYKSVNPFEDADELTATNSFTLLENIRELQFYFWNPKNLKWEDSLQGVKKGKHILRAVKVFFKEVDSEGNEREINRIFRPSWPFYKPEDIKEMYKNKKLIDEDIIEVEEDKNSGENSGGEN